MNAQQILDFWFSPETEPYWFAKSDAFDAKIHAQFLAVWQQAAAGELYH
jgi:spoVR like family protein